GLRGHDHRGRPRLGARLDRGRGAPDRAQRLARGLPELPAADLRDAPDPLVAVHAGRRRARLPLSERRAGMRYHQAWVVALGALLAAAPAAAERVVTSNEILIGGLNCVSGPLACTGYQITSGV